MSLPKHTQKNLEMQGFRCDTAQFANVEPWLRFSPAICFFAVLWGLWQGSAGVFYIVAVMSAIGVFTPHAFGDWIYNYGIRFLTSGPVLPPTHPPRRFACFMGMIWGTAVGLLFSYGYASIAYILGTIFLIVIIPMIFTHFCTASFIYRKLFG